ncbi:hypothetical protein BDF19DRAFT_425313 [Syncephalis fuscata]|nr:hypothetical protein BDF19DRAFT_425313 [Syncephalis fuscata]
METVQRDLQAFQARTLNVEQLLDQVENETRDDYGGKSGIHPGRVDSTRIHYRELYSKLKLSFLEMNSKEKFMHAISQDPPTMATKEMVKTLVRIEGLSDSLSNKVHSVVEVKDQTRKIVDEAIQLLAETKQMEEEFKLVEDMIANHEQMTSKEAERILDEQKQQLQQIYASTEEQQQEVDDLQWELEVAYQELAQLEKEQQVTESMAVEANRMAKQSDPRIQEIHGWYESAIATLLQLVGVADFRMDTHDTLLVTYSATNTKTDSDSAKILKIIFDPVTLKIQDAQWQLSSATESPPLVIDDIVEYARQRDSLPLLLWQIQRRFESLTDESK